MSYKNSKTRLKKILEELALLYTDARAELNYTNGYELLVAVILSAQCTDVRVNIITKDLFKEANNPIDMISLGVERIESLIKSCGMFRQKAKNIYNTSILLRDNFKCQIPDTLEELITLPGVGRKTANVVISNLYDKPAIAVDTHVMRLSNRLGFVSSKNPVFIETSLQRLFPKNEWTKLHHRLILHGRRVCKARNPLCDKCTLFVVCPRIGVVK